jgi:1-acyl-sn-glycerol-3-phosphate acyltransferase
MTEDHAAATNRNGEPACGREPLVEAISTFLAHKHASGMSEIRASLVRTIDEAGPDGIEFLGKRLARAGTDWSYYPRDPLARRIHHVLAARVLRHAPVVLGTEHLDAVAGKPLVIFANHLSYSDANVMEVLLQQVGGRELSDRLTVVAGPKVYSDVKRRFSSLCFGTIKTPQSSARSTDEAVMSPRDVVRAARRSIQIAQERLGLGEALLVFAEGTRSRSSRMQRLLTASARYLEPPGTWVMPVGIAGTERLFPIGEDSLNPVPITLRIGQPVPASVLGERAREDRRLIMDCVGVAIAELLPHAYRGAYGDEVPDLEDARRLLCETTS